MLKSKKVLFTTSTIAFLVISAQASEAGETPKECRGKDHTIQLGDMGQVFNQFLGGRLDVFAEQPICWDDAKNEKYDKFFNDANFVIADFRLAQRLIKIMTEVGDKEKVTAGSDFVVAAVALIPLVKEAKDKVESLISTCKSLGDAAKSDFSGITGMSKLSKVVGNLNNIIDNLRAIAKEMQSIVDGITKMTAYAGGNAGTPAQSESASTDGNAAPAGGNQGEQYKQQQGNPTALQPQKMQQLCEETKLPERKIKCGVDSECLPRLKVSVEELKYFRGDLAAVEKNLTQESGRMLDWLMAILEKAVPTPRFTASCGEIKDENGWLTYNVQIKAADSKYLPSADATTKNSLNLVIESMKKFSIPQSVPIASKLVCIDVEPLAQELGLNGVGKLRTRLPLKAIEGLKAPDLKQLRRGYVTLEDSQGVAVAEAHFDWAGLVKIVKSNRAGSNKEDKCLCDLSISVSPKRNVEGPIVLGPLTSAEATRGKVINVRMSGPGKPLDRRYYAVERPPVAPSSKESDSAKFFLDLTPYTELLRAAYLGNIAVQDKINEPERVVLRVGVSPPSLEKIKDIREKAVRLSQSGAKDKFGGDVCLLDQKGLEMARFSAGAFQLKQFEDALSGVENIASAVVMDLRKTGLGINGAVEIPMKENEKKKFTRLIASSPGTVFTMRLEKKPALERTAVVQMPVENAQPLRLKVMLSPALAITPTDKILITGAGYSLEVPLFSFPEAGKVMEALLTNFGIPKDVKIPASAFSVVRNQVKVSYAPGAVSLAAVLTDTEGRVIANQNIIMDLGLTADKPLNGTCYLLLRPDPDKLTGEILFDNLFPWEIEQLGDTTIVNREYNDIGFKYKVPAACGPEE